MSHKCVSKYNFNIGVLVGFIAWDVIKRHGFGALKNYIPTMDWHISILGALSA